MATLNSYTSAKKLAGILLVVLLSNATSVAKGQPGGLPDCLLECDVQIIKCAEKCKMNVGCLMGCLQTFIKCKVKCLPKNGTTGAPPAPPTKNASGNETGTVKAVAIISSSEKSSIKGSLQFLQESIGERTHVKGIIAGLSPGLHGLHIEFVSSCSSINGPHFHPENKEYGSQSTEMLRAYCLGNVVANSNGIAHVEGSIEEKDMPVNGPHSVLGLAVIVHADEKVGCGNIELK